MLKTVKDMYAISKGANTPLLSEYNGDFWQEYINNFQHYDSVFKRLYSSFYYFMQDIEDDTATVTSDFTNDVYNVLMMNSKKYSQLYKIYDIDDYNIDSNIDIKKTNTKTYNLSTIDDGAEHKDTLVADLGTRKDKNVITTDPYKDTITDTTNAFKDVISNEYATNTKTSMVAPYDSDDFSNENKETIDARTDKVTSDIPEHKVTRTNDIATHVNTNDIDVGAQKNTNTNTYGATKDTRVHRGTVTDSYNEVGSTESVDTLLEKHQKMWNSYEFYHIIFRDICKELLSISNV